MGFAADAVVSIQLTLQDAPRTALLVVVIVTLMWLFTYSLTKVFMRWTETKEWWPAAAPRQAQLMRNFAFTEEALTDNAILEGWSAVLVICIHHGIAGAMLAPVTFWGWKDNEWGQLLFFVGMLLELAFDVSDSISGTFRRFCPKLWSCQSPVPCLFWFITVCCHHQLATFMILPMLRYYSDFREFHRIACSLMLAAAFCYATGAYKFTLDTTTKADFYKYKVIVLLQFLVIIFTRVYVWFTEAASLISRFNEEESWGFFYGSIVGCCLMTFFNLAMVSDCTSAAIKWLPRKMPTEEAAILDLERSKSNLSWAVLNGSFAEPKGNQGTKKEGLNKSQIEF